MSALPEKLCLRISMPERTTSCFVHRAMSARTGDSAPRCSSPSSTSSAVAAAPRHSLRNRRRLRRSAARFADPVAQIATDHVPEDRSVRCWGRPRGFAPTGHEPARPGAQRAAQAPAHPPRELPRGARAPGGAAAALRRPRARRLPRLWPARGGVRALRVRGLRPDAGDRAVVQRSRLLPALLRPAHDGAGAPPGSARVPGARSREAVGALSSVRAAGSGGVRPRAGAGLHAHRDAGHRVALPAAGASSGVALAARRLGDGAPAIWLRLAAQPAPSRLVLGRRLRRRRARDSAASLPHRHRAQTR